MKYSNLLYIKNKLLGIFLGAVLFCLLGCGGDGGGSAAKGVIAYTPQTLSNPFFSVIAENIRAEAEKNGYEFLVVDPDMDVKKQSDQRVRVDLGRLAGS